MYPESGKQRLPSSVLDKVKQGQHVCWIWEPTVTTVCNR